MATAAEQAVDHFLALVRGFDTAMLVTRSGEAMHARPMAVARVDDGGDVWFITSLVTPKIDEIAADDHAMVVMQGQQKYLAVSGRAEVVRDPDLVKRLWSEKWRVWFRDARDPDLVLIHVRPTEAEYWDGSGLSGLKFGLAAIAAYVKGDEITPPDDVRSHAKLPL